MPKDIYAVGEIPPLGEVPKRPPRSEGTATGNGRRWVRPLNKQ